MALMRNLVSVKGILVKALQDVRRCLALCYTHACLESSQGLKALKP